MSMTNNAPSHWKLGEEITGATPLQSADVLLKSGHYFQAIQLLEASALKGDLDFNASKMAIDEIKTTYPAWKEQAAIADLAVRHAAAQKRKKTFNYWALAIGAGLIAFIFLHQS